MTRADRKRERRELADWMRANGITPNGEAWRLASVEGSRDVAALVAANVTDGCPAKRLPDGSRLPGGIRAGDYLPDHHGTTVGDPVPDPERGTVWVTLANGQDIELPAGEPVVVVRTREAPAWIQAAAADYRAARDAWEALRESSTLAPSTVPGIAGSDATMSQLEPADYEAACPRPRYVDYVRDHAARMRAPA